MNQAKSSFGTLLKIGDGASPENFTTVAEVKDITGPDIKTDFEDVTTHDSAAAGNFKEWLATLQDGGEVKAEVHWVPTDTTHIRIQTDQTNRVLRNYQIVWPMFSNKTASFAAYVSGFPFKSPIKGVASRELTLRITGPVTLS